MTNPPAHIWQPLEGLPPWADQWRSEPYDKLSAQWKILVKALTAKTTDRKRLNIWLRERRRAFAIETGQIEGLYTLRRGVTEQLITEGLETVRSAHSMENLDDHTLKGLLKDQEEAIEMVFKQVVSDKPLNEDTIKEWHRIVTRHQETLVARLPSDPDSRITAPFVRKGEYKQRPNNPREQTGVVFEYAPPDKVPEEMRRLLELHEEIAKKQLPTHVEAAWLHHRFVRTHPFEDGNGRVARLLMTYIYTRNNELTPLITKHERGQYYQALNQADNENLLGFSEHLRIRATWQLENAIEIANNILSGTTRFYHPNGSFTDEDGYHKVNDGVDISPGET